MLSKIERPHLDFNPECFSDVYWKLKQADSRFVVVYGGVFGAGVYYMARLIRSGPLDFPPPHDATPARPLSAPGDAIEGRP